MWIYTILKPVGCEGKRLITEVQFTEHSVLSPITPAFSDLRPAFLGSTYFQFGEVQTICFSCEGFLLALGHQWGGLQVN